MRSLKLTTLLAFMVGAAQGYPSAQQDQDLDSLEFNGPTFRYTCPEKNGLFADEEQCDLYYVCEDNVAEAVLCPDGQLFDISIRNHEKCVLPHNVDCGKREFVQERQKDIDDRCPRANGLFDHEDPAVCDRFYTCDKGTAHEMPCAFPLVFDVVIGACVRPEQISPEAKVCSSSSDDNNLVSIEGFTCPGKQIVGPRGVLDVHPLFPHPNNCRFFFSCSFGVMPNKLGCPEGEVFDAATKVCKDSNEVSECKCWYECGKDSRCPGDCNADCSCPVNDPNGFSSNQQQELVE